MIRLMYPDHDTSSLGTARAAEEAGSGISYTVNMAKRAFFRYPATERDLDNLPEDVVGHIVDGELIVHPRPEGPHVYAASALANLIGSGFWFGLGGPGGWVILAEPRILFGNQNLVPDLAGWKKERYKPVRKGPYTVTPDWVCEILSPSTASFDRVTKLPMYASAEVGHAWILDPAARALEVFRLQHQMWLLASTVKAEGLIRAEPFESVELNFSLLWEGPEALAEEG